MPQTLSLAKKLLLTPASLDEGAIDKLMRLLRGKQIDIADLYFQSCSYESWFLEDSEVKSGSYSIDKGVGIRAVCKDKTGFAYCDNLLLPAMERAVVAARSIALSGADTTLPILKNAYPPIRYQPINPIEGMSKQEKIALLEAIDKEARAIDPRVIHVNASLSGCHEVILIAGMDGEMTADIRPLVSIHVSVIVEDKHGKRESARSGGGGRVNYSYFLEKERALIYAREAVREALVNLDAEPAPAGTMPVVLGPGWPGVLLHEAVGHGLEGDFNRKGLSAFSGKIGEQVASPGITVVDDGTLADRRGSLTVDDEGTPAQCTTLI
jgi:TldD protein